MKKIKFRVWDNVDYMTTFSLDDLQTQKIVFTSDCPVMQYTGLKDKNGKEIYEGDKAQYFNRSGQIIYDELRGAYGLYTRDDDVFVQLLNTVLKDLEITGNIYENQ